MLCVQRCSVPAVPCFDGQWHRQDQWDTKEVQLEVCLMKLHFMQGRGLGLEGVPGSLCCVPKGRRQP
jgi:hypothetical protein